MMKLKNKTVFISGGSRGIGKHIGIKLASLGANIIIAAKTTEPHPRLPGTIFTAAEEMKKAGGQAFPVKTDIRSDEEVLNAVESGVEQFGGIDIVINNASAINLVPSEHIEMKRYDLMQDINTRGTFLVTKTCLPYLKKAHNPHVITLSPPLHMNPLFFGGHTAYTISKFGMSMCMLGMAEEYRDYGIACNALWPKTTIATAAVQNLLGGDQMMKQSRKPSIVADAVEVIIQKDSKSFTGQFLIDEEILIEAGIKDFDVYAVDPSQTLMPDLFVEWED